jgi:hypothetical protein
MESGLDFLSIRLAAWPAYPASNLPRALTRDLGDGTGKQSIVINKSGVLL